LQQGGKDIPTKAKHAICWNGNFVNGIFGDLND